MITLFCDNACDLWKDQIVSWNVKVLNFDYIIDNVLQKDTLDTPEELDEFYQKLKNGAVATTKPISERRILKIFEDEVKEGNDVLFIHISNQLTTSYNCLPKVIDKLKVDYPERKVVCINSQNISMGAGLLVYIASKLIAKGKNIDEIEKAIELQKNKISCMFAVDNIENLHKGTKLPLNKNVGGKMLGVKPIIKINDTGKLIKVTSVKGQKNLINKFLFYIETLGENAGDFPIVVLHAGNEQDAIILKNEIINKVGNDSNVWIQPIGTAVGPYCGYGAIGLVFRTRGK